MILVTGGTGLVGSYLLYALALKGLKVKALLRPGKKEYQTGHLLSCLAGENKKLIDQIEWVEGDILDTYSLQQAMKGVTQVYHCAALVSFDPRMRNEMLAVNIEGSANVVNACLENGVSKLCHVSSIAALGQAEKGDMIDEKARWKTSKLNSGYAVSKYGAEREVWRGIEEGLNAVIVNPSVIIGAGCHPKATNRLFHSMKSFLPFYTSGVNGYVDVRDVVDAMIMLMESDISGERFVLNAENLALKDLFIKAADILGKPHPRFALNPTMLALLARVEELRCRIIGSRPLLTSENVRSALAKSYYSASKFSTSFNFNFIPIKDSLTEAFRILALAEKK